MSISLAGEKPEALQISFFLLEQGQGAIDVYNAAIATFHRNFLGDTLGSRREDGQLQLRHRHLSLVYPELWRK